MLDRDEIFVRMMVAQLQKVVVAGGAGSVGGWKINVGYISKMADVAEAVTEETMKRLDAARAAKESEASRCSICRGTGRLITIDGYPKPACDCEAGERYKQAMRATGSEGKDAD